MGIPKKILAAALLTAFALFACVTINIYFPAEKVESAAGRIVDDIRDNRPDPENQGRKGNQSYNRHGILDRIRAAISPAAAWAQEATTVSNPTIRALKKKMKERFQALKPYYKEGVLKERDDGYLAISDAGGLGLKEKRDLKGLVEAENEDRRTLYKEVAKALQIDPGQIEKIAQIFAKEWQKPVR
jgi:uncharacterized protein YdbL (DUF1318 family)